MAVYGRADRHLQHQGLRGRLQLSDRFEAVLHFFYDQRGRSHRRDRTRLPRRVRPLPGHERRPLHGHMRAVQEISGQGRPSDERRADRPSDQQRRVRRLSRRRSDGDQRLPERRSGRHLRLRAFHVPASVHELHAALLRRLLRFLGRQELRARRSRLRPGRPVRHELHLLPADREDLQRPLDPLFAPENGLQDVPDRGGVRRRIHSRSPHASLSRGRDRNGRPARRLADAEQKDGQPRGRSPLPDRSV